MTKLHNETKAGDSSLELLFADDQGESFAWKERKGT